MFAESGQSALQQSWENHKIVVEGSKWELPTAFSCWDEREPEALQRVIRSGQFTMGPEVKAFEEEFAAYHGMKYGIAVNSGSSANLLMIAVLFAKKHRPLKRGDLAIVPAIAWSTTYSPLVIYGMRLKLVDVDDSWNSQLPDVNGARLVVGCSILGNPAPLGFLKNAAESHDEYFIEDNCESLGAWHGVKRCGTFGLMNSFSFYFSHQISAGELGIVLTNDSECNQLCRILRAHGWTRDVYPPTSFDEEYSFTHYGLNVRPTEFYAAVAREQLKKLDGFVKLRRINHQLFLNLTKVLPIKHPTIRGEPSPFGLAFRSIRPKPVVNSLRSSGAMVSIAASPLGAALHNMFMGAPGLIRPHPRLMKSIGPDFSLAMVLLT